MDPSSTAACCRIPAGSFGGRYAGVHSTLPITTASAAGRTLFYGSNSSIAGFQASYKAILSVGEALIGPLTGERRSVHSPATLAREWRGVAIYQTQTMSDNCGQVDRDHGYSCIQDGALRCRNVADLHSGLFLNQSVVETSSISCGNRPREHGCPRGYRRTRLGWLSCSSYARSFNLPLADMMGRCLTVSTSCHRIRTISI